MSISPNNSRAADMVQKIELFINMDLMKPCTRRFQKSEFEQTRVVSLGCGREGGEHVW